jgi:hypothetical protein
LASSGISGLSQVNNVNTSFFVLAEGESDQAKEIACRYTGQKISTTAQYTVNTWKEPVISLPATTLIPCLRIFGFSLFEKDLTDITLQTITIWRSRSQLDLQPELLLMLNALFHKFTIARSE